MNRILYRISNLRVPFILLLAVCLIFVPLSLNARSIDEQDVRTAVETWVRYVTADARPDAFIERMELYQVNGETVAYIANLFGGGFCICGMDEMVLPVYFYCPKGTYDPENPGYQYILWEIKTRLKYLREGLEKGDTKVIEHQQQLSERAAFWQELISGSVYKKAEQVEKFFAEPDSMSLMLTCRWGQGSPYNDQCPELTPNADEHTIVGCTATAISQIMYYWKWPNTGAGTHSVNYNYRWRTNWDEQPLTVNPNIPAGWTNRLQWTAASGGRLRMNGYWDGSVYGEARKISNGSAYRIALDSLYSRLTHASTNNFANFGAMTYQWNLMQDTHTDPVDAGDIAVATLCYHVAIALDTGFGIYSSGSDLWRAVDPNNNRKPLVNNFLYDADAYYEHVNIVDRVTEDIQWLRPVGFSGSGPAGGHAWILYGYNKSTDPNRQFKMNMGWSGGSDGWYSLDNVPLGLNQNHGYLIYIAPQNVVRFVGNTISGDGSPVEPYKDIEEAITNASDGTTLIFKAGSDNTFSAPLTINRPLTLKGRDVTIRKN